MMERLSVLRQLVSRLWSYAGARAWWAACLMILSALLEGVGLLLLLPILGVIISGPLDNFVGDALLRLGFETPTSQLVVLIGAFLLATMIRAQIIHVRDITLGKVNLGFAKAERVDVISRLAVAGWSQISALSHARVTSLIANDVPRASTAAQFLLRISVSVLMMLVNGAIAFALAPDLVGLFVLILLLGALFLWFAQKDAFSLGDRVRNSAKAMMESTQNMLSGLKTALAQGSQARFVKEFSRVQDLVFDSQLDFQLSQSKARRFYAIASGFLASGLVLGGILLEVEPTRLIVLVVVLSRLNGPLLQIQQSLQQLLFSLPSFVALLEIREQLPLSKLVDQTSQPRPEGALELRDVSYRHVDGGGVGPVSFKIEPGEFLGISGPSGAGKSTLIDILAGLLSPQSGSINIGGKPMDAERSAAWQRHLSYLGQQVYLFNDTLAENLTWDTEKAQEEDIWNALEMAGVANLVRGLNQGLNSPLGESGSLFSGGERQRIALARALLRKPSFLILDEATSAIDIASEERVLARLAELPERPTIIMIAHRAESLAQCDRVIRLDAGRLVEEG